MKKVVIIGIVLLGLGLMFLGAEDSNSYNNLLPKPDKLLLYYNNQAIEVKSDSDYFNNIYDLIDNRFQKNIYISETSISVDDVKDIKSDIAVEYVYFQKNEMEFKGNTINYSKILFPLDKLFGEHMIFYNNAEYRSAPISNLKESKELVETVKKLFE